MPIAMKIWSERGAAAAGEFIDGTFAWYVVVAPAVVAGMAAVGPELLPFLASSKYAAGVSIVPWVIAGMAVDGAGVLLGAGLFVERQTFTIMQLVLGSAVVNIALNLVLVPSFGIVGAAAATLVTYVGLAVAMAVRGARWLPVRIPWGGLLRSSVAGAIMYLVVSGVVAGSRPATIAVRMAIGAAVYAGIIVALEPRAREAVRAARARITRRRVTS
jgi:O-antigen/teichoic acid export membrane protein